MALKIKQNGQIKDLIIPASGVEVLDMDGNFRSNNLETVLKELSINGGSGGGTGTGGSGYPKDAEFVYVKDSEPDMDGVWFDQSDTSSDLNVGENSVVKSIRDYIDTDVKSVVNKNDKIVSDIKEKVGDKLDVVSQLSNPNLLINGDFQIWQRGTRFTNVAIGTYQADRWMVVSTNGDYLATVTKVSNGLRIEQSDAGCVIRQYIEEDLYNKIKDKILTMSKSVDGIITIDKIKPTNINGKYLFEIPIGRNVTINWIKIEIGTVATPFVSRPYGEELALCRRYYIPNLGNGYGYWNGTDMYATIPTPVKMRVAPTAIVSSIGDIKTVNGIFKGLSGVSTTYIHENAVLIKFTFSSKPTNVTNLTPIYYDNANISFDAEIY